MKNRTFAEALDLLKAVVFNTAENNRLNRRYPSEMCEPEKVKRIKVGETVFVVGTFFKSDSKDTLKDILERSIRREAMSRLRN